MRRDVSGFSPRQTPKICRNIRNNCLLPTGTRPGAFRIIRIIPATPAKHAGDSVAQREFIHNVAATPLTLLVLECCSVADQTAILGSAHLGKLDFARAQHPWKFFTLEVLILMTRLLNPQLQ